MGVATIKPSPCGHPAGSSVGEWAGGGFAGNMHCGVATASHHGTGWCPGRAAATAEPPRRPTHPRHPPARASPGCHHSRPPGWTKRVRCRGPAPPAGAQRGRAGQEWWATGGKVTWRQRGDQPLPAAAEHLMPPPRNPPPQPARACLPAHLVQHHPLICIPHAGGDAAVQAALGRRCRRVRAAAHRGRSAAGAHDGAVQPVAQLDGEAAWQAQRG